MTTALLVGSGAREHAIANALAKSGVDIIAHMSRNNPGISSLAQKRIIGDILDERTFTNLPEVDYAIIGPEAPLERGITNHLERHDVSCVAPRQEAARIETSKSFARRILEKVSSDANPRYKIANSLDDLRSFEDEIGVENMVVKPDGLTGGKGVRIYGEHFFSRDELERYAITNLEQRGKVVLEERMDGLEFTVQCFTDGNHLRVMPLVRDYKRAFDNDKGPNTGSMGSYSKPSHGLEYVSEAELEKALDIMQATLEGIKKQTKYDYKGILYGQFMKTTEGLKVVEFNARFGDPEAINVLSILNTSFDDICRGIIEGNLAKPDFANKATVCVYVVPKGYPSQDVAAESPIAVGGEMSSGIHYASVNEKDGKILTTGSRALALCGIADTVSEAREIAYRDIQNVTGDVRYRSDIALGVE